MITYLFWHSSTGLVPKRLCLCQFVGEHTGGLNGYCFGNVILP